MPSPEAPCNLNLDWITIRCKAEELLAHVSDTVPASQRLAETAISQTLRDIDKVMSLTQSRVHELQNALVPINTLPPEVLTHIFKLLQYLPNPALLSPAERGTILSHLCKPSSRLHVCQTTHVCRYWRRAALGAGSLWDTFSLRLDDLRHPDSFPSICLQRSSGALLNIAIQPLYEVVTLEDPVWDLLTLHVGRLRTLVMTHVPGTRAGLLDHLTTAALMLQDLRIEYDDYYGAFSGNSTRGEQEAELPTLFAGHTPQLRRLEVHVFRRFPGNNFKDLASLQLCSQIYTTSAEMGHLFRLLEASPTLIELSLWWCTLRIDSQTTQVESSSDASSTAPTRVALHKLARLDLQDCSQGFTRCLLGQVELPPQRLIISIRDPTFDLVDGLLLQTVIAHLAPLRSLQLISGELVRVKASGSSNVAWIDCPSRSDFVVWGRPSSWMTQDLRRMFSLSTIVELKLAGADTSGFLEWSSAFMEMVVLTRVIMDLRDYSESLHIYNWLVALFIVEAKNLQSCPAPNLIELCICSPHPSAWRVIILLCERRAAIKRPLRHLRIMLPKGATRMEDYFCAGSDETWVIMQDKLRESGTSISLESGDGYFTQNIPQLDGTYIIEALATV